MNLPYKWSALNMSPLMLSQQQLRTEDFAAIEIITGEADVHLK
jgi:hypothetical protein